MLRHLSWNWQGVLLQIVSLEYISIWALVRLGPVVPPGQVASTGGAEPGGVGVPPNLPPCKALGIASGSFVLRMILLDFVFKHDSMNLAVNLALYSRKCETWLLFSRVPYLNCC